MNAWLYRSSIPFLAFAVACGGSQPADNDTVPVGQSTQSSDLDVDKPNGDAPETPPDGQDKPEGDPDGGTKTDPKPASAVTFAIKNSGSEELVFNMDRGWQPVIFAFSGKPPKAKPIIMFPKFCTASCDAAAKDRCPYCPQPERVKEIRKLEKRETVAPGKTLEVPWDGQQFLYERTKGTRDGRTKRCECHKKSPAPPETYTVRACGLRVTKSARKRSKLQCVDGTMTLPGDGPIRVDLDFPNPK